MNMNGNKMEIDDIVDNGVDLKLVLQWEKSFSFGFNVVQLGKVFDYKSSRILLGTTDGKIRILEGNQEIRTLESKGSAIFSMIVEDVTKLGAPDLIVGDAEGMITLFSNYEILSRMNLSKCITALTVDDNAVISGDRGGHLLAFQPPSDLRWKQRLVDSNSIPNQNNGNNMSISCLLSTNMEDTFGLPIHVLLVASEASDHIHFYNQGTRIYSLPVPSKVRSLCIGYFVDIGEEKPSTKLQIAAGCDDGFIYVIEDYKLIKYAKVGHPVVQLLPFHFGSRNDNLNRFDYIFCTGHFNSIKIFWKGKLLKEQKTIDWVHAFSIGESDGIYELALAQLHNNTLQMFQILQTKSNT